MKWKEISGGPVKTLAPEGFRSEVKVVRKRDEAEVSVVSANRRTGETIVIRIFDGESAEFHLLRNAVAQMHSTGPVFIPGISRSRPMQCEWDNSACDVATGPYIVIEDEGGPVVGPMKLLQGQAVIYFGILPAHMYFTLRGQWWERAADIYNMLNKTEVAPPNKWPLEG
jgi:hypothetical protein